MEELSVISITYEVHKKLIELNITVDRKYHFSLSEPCISACRSVLNNLILAKHAPKALKNTYLIKAGADAETTALLLRTILELNLSNETNVLKIQARLSDARRQIGGWHKSLPS
jgi:hypothetical protein